MKLSSAAHAHASTTIRQLQRTVSVAALILLAACSGDSDFSGNSYLSSGNNPEPQLFDNVNRSDFRNADGTVSPLSQTLANCVIIETFEEVCPLSTLSFIGAPATLPTKQQIMDRLIVSHDWMADNFSQLLDRMPEDMYRLFGSTTAIVIHSHIRPAFFLPATGAIYLDPQYLWLTAAQRNTISNEQDYRAGFASQVGFANLATYTKNNDFAFGDSTAAIRGQSQTLYALSALLFHELAHAADQYPLTLIAGRVDADVRPFNLIKDDQDTSSDLDRSLPLTSTTMRQIGQVLFQGEKASSTIAALTAAEVGSHFETDGASDTYAYSTKYEDTAMLFEEFMMKIHYNVDRELAFADRPISQPCQDYNVTYRISNRYQDVIQRVEFVVDRLLPGHTHQSFMTNFPTRANTLICKPALQSRQLGHESDDETTTEPALNIEDVLNNTTRWR
ncbi:Uncharacterised protein [BD1-7 clade bacterium]|uniref:Uncharacterized protein n=1 Tax=BD1-7 clade bacterium TaxID=2029982 RepID=A0A5S9N326_9GAMM|nr:Uncharacterised protein [BD1-7 clade bacterium]